jgi:hypothetical protein
MMISKLEPAACVTSAAAIRMDRSNIIAGVQLMVNAPVMV